MSEDVRFFEINKQGEVFQARDGKWVMRSDYDSLLAEKNSSFQRRAVFLLKFHNISNKCVYDGKYPSTCGCLYCETNRLLKEAKKVPIKKDKK